MMSVAADILEYLGEAAELLSDPAVSEVMINNLRVFVEHSGRKSQVFGLQLNARQIDAAARRIARASNEEISEANPVCKARLEDGTRVTIVVRPAAQDGTILTFRKFRREVFTLAELVDKGMFPTSVYTLLIEAVVAGKTMLLSGENGAGKTTLLNACASLIPREEWIALIENPPEIQIEHPNALRLVASDSDPARSPRELTKIANRLNVDRIVFGEVLGGEALDLLQALNSGHQGSFCTIHANSARLALSKLTNYALRGSSALDATSTVSYVPVRREIADAFDYVLQVEKQKDGKRIVSEVLAIDRYDPASDEFVCEQLYDSEKEQNTCS